LHALDSDSTGFQWIIGDDRANSVYAFYRAGVEGTPPVIAICNFTPVPRLKYLIGAPRKGRWREAINTDAAIYGGSNLGNGGQVMATDRRSHGQPFSIELTVPPLATVLLRFDE
jgi:1,4-alpha-glucan branching enzyme